MAFEGKVTKTRRLRADASDLGSSNSVAALSEAAALLRSGGTVAFPTETVYGLGANALDPSAVGRIFRAKDRPAWDPLIVHVCDEAMLLRVVGLLPADVAAKARSLMDAFWPGPLTLLLPRRPDLPLEVTAGRERVGVRMPRHPLAVELIRQAGVPIAAPSANRFGHTSPTTADHVLADLDGRIDAVLEGGATQVGVESTVLDVFPEAGGGEMLIYRPGAVTLEQIQSLVGGEVRMHTPPSGSRSAARDPERQEGLPSPGVGLRHYAPRARLILAEDSYEFWQQLDRLSVTSERVGIMLPHGWEIETSIEAIIYQWGAMEDIAAQAHGLFAGLRELDAHGATVILCPLPADEGLGVAMRDRLRKAARPS